MQEIPVSNCTGIGADDGVLISTAQSPTLPDSSFHIFILVLLAILTLLAIACVIIHYRMGARAWSDRQRREQAKSATTSASGSQKEANPSTSVIQFSAALQERFQREMEELRDRQIRMQSVYRDTMLDLPPSIPYRGSEGSKQPYNSCIRPPPNRTVYSSSYSVVVSSKAGLETVPLVVKCHGSNNSHVPSSHRKVQVI